MNIDNSRPSIKIRTSRLTKNTGARLRCLAMVWGAFSLLPAVFAANVPPPFAVQSSVTVQGVVEVLNDITSQPYGANGQVNLDQNSTTVSLNFDVPNEKRLIVETITFQAGTSPQAAPSLRIFVEPLFNGKRVFLGSLAVQSTSIESSTSTYAIGTHAIKVRVDSVPGSTNELQIRVGRTLPQGIGSGSPVNFVATVYGYLVDMPLQP